MTKLYRYQTPAARRKSNIRRKKIPTLTAVTELISLCAGGDGDAGFGKAGPLSSAVPAGTFLVGIVLDVAVGRALLIRLWGHGSGKLHGFCGMRKSATAMFDELELTFLKFQACMEK